MLYLNDFCRTPTYRIVVADRLRNPVRSTLGTLVTFVFTVLCGSCTQQKAPAIEKASRPNLVLIVADTLRADRVEMQRNGKPLMPNLAKFAGESWHFRNCRVQAAWTKPSMATLFTSLYPEVHRVLFGVDGDMDSAQLPRTDVLPESLETLAELVKAHGYSTAGIQTNANITAHFGFDQGFDSYDVKNYPKFHGNDVTDLAIDRLEALSPPFFLYTHYMDTHAPYETPAGYVDVDAHLPELSDRDKEQLTNYGEGYRDRIMFEVGIASQRKFGNLSKDGEDYVRAKYDSSAHFLDGEIARLIARVLERHPDTIVVITSDHGEELWEHGSVGHGKTVYEEVARVPLIVKKPNATPRSIDAPVESIDVLPTCASMLGIPPQSEWQGKNIHETSTDLADDRPIFCSAQMSMSGSNRDLDSVTVGMRKLIVDKKTETKTVLDLSKDQAEMAGAQLSSEFGDSALLQALEQHRALNLAHRLRQETPATSELTPEQQANIRNIGYLR